MVEEFDEWYQELYPRLYAALRLTSRSPEDAADAVSDAFTKAFEQWDRVRVMDNPGGWTFRVALNAGRRRGRRRAAERRLVEAAAAAHARPSVSPGAEAAISELAWLVGDLPERMAQVVVLRHVGDLTEPAIADALGISRGTVSSTLRDAHARLAALIEAAESNASEAAASEEAPR